MGRRNGRDTVVQLYPHGISPDDAGVIEMIIQLFGGEEVSIRALEATHEPMDSIRSRMQAEPGVQVSESAGWRFPVMRCTHDLGERKRSVLVVVDQGSVRMFLHRITTR